MARRRTLTSTLYRAARISATGRAVRTGHAGRRAKNIVVGRALGTLGVLALALEVALRRRSADRLGGMAATRFTPRSRSAAGSAPAARSPRATA